MKNAVRLAAGAILVVASLISASASSAASTLQPGVLDRAPVAVEDGAVVIRVGHRKATRAQGRKTKSRTYRRHHRKFHKRYHPRKRHYRKAHKRFHRHYRRRHSGPKIRVDIYTGYYDPYHYSPHYNDPYYYGPPYRSRLICKRARRIVRRHGYHRVRAYDCRGKVYGFIGYFKGKRYKIRVSAYSGAILSRRRY
ncbi:MAG: hypothetical protein HKN11_03925 [Rhizobiales bacterium]|nr:hypothetical protein [Hyphomicrobiales bacterium]